jgi:hypothetical protein
VNIAYSLTLPGVEPDTFVTFPGGGDVLPGPGTLVWLVFADVDADQSLQTQVLERADNLTIFVIEDETVAADVSNQTGFQSTPVPLVNDSWGTMLGVRIVGGTVNHDVNVVAIQL